MVKKYVSVDDVTGALPSIVNTTIDGRINAHSAVTSKVPETRQVNGHALTGNVTVTKSDVGLGNAADRRQIARNPDLIIAGSVTYDSYGIIATAAVVWPDGSSGTFTTLVANSTHLTVDSYQITYGSPVTLTYTQPTITRNSSGQPTTVPAITEA